MADPKNKWAQPAAPPAPMFFGKKERELVKQVNDELAERVIGQAIAYYPISLEESNFNKTYGEAVEKVSLPPVRVYAYVVVENEQSNEKYGYEYTNKLTVNFHRARLTADQDLYVRVGDYVQYGDKFYEIVKTYNDTRYLFGQVEHKFQISADCVEARPGSFRVEKALTRPTTLSSSAGDTSGPAPRPAPYPPLDATYITVTASPKLPNERVLTAGAGIELTDTGAGGALTIASTAGGDSIFTAVSADAAYTTSSATFGAATTPTDTITIAGSLSGSGASQIVGNSVFGGTLKVSGNAIFETSASVGTTTLAAQLYVSGAHDEMIFQAAGSTGGDIFVVSGSGLVGINTSSADVVLHMVSSSNDDAPSFRLSGDRPRIQFDEGDQATKYQIQASNGSLKWQVQNSAFDAASVKWMMNSDGQMAFRDGSAGDPILARVHISGSGDSFYVEGATTLSGAVVHKRKAIINDYSVELTDYYLGIDTTDGAVDLTLPAASTATEGQTYVIKDEGGNALANSINVLRSGTDTIDGSTSVALSSDYAALSLYTNGTNWFIY